MHVCAAYSSAALAGCFGAVGRLALMDRSVPEPSSACVNLSNARSGATDEVRVGGRYADVTPMAATVPQPPHAMLFATALGISARFTRPRILARAS